MDSNRTARHQRTFEEITGHNKQIEVLEANGSVKSIMDWAVKAKLNSQQHRAFEIFVGTFVLSFYSSDGEDEETG